MGIYTSLYELCDFNDGELLHFEKVTNPKENGRPVITTPHYSNTIELVLIDNVEGIASIGGERFVFNGKNVLYIAPGVIHSMIYNSGDGDITVAKLYTEIIRKYINIDELLSDSGMSLNCFSPLQNEYDSIKKQLCMITDCGCSLIDQTIGILRLLSQLSLKDSEPKQKLPDSSDFALREVIDWTEKNLAGHITLSEVAQHFGYSKNYFCERFRRAAGATYVTYLNLLRVSHSLALLAAGESLSSVCAACGFTNESYYIRLFKSIIGMTPASWKRQTRPQ